MTTPCPGAGRVTGVSDAESRSLDRGGRLVRMAANHWALAIETHHTNHPTVDQAGMAFARDYVVLGNKREQVRQLGGAVTPPAARDLIAAVAEALTAQVGSPAGPRPPDGVLRLAPPTPRPTRTTGRTPR